MRRLVFFLALAGLLLSSYGPKVSAATTDRAATPVGITVAPILHTVSIANFEISQSFPLKVTNHTSTKRNFAVSVTDFGAQGEFGGIAFLGLKASDYTTKHGLVRWLTIDKTNFSLAPNASINLIATLRNDESLLPGGHYGAVLVNEVSSNKAQPNSVSANPTVSSLIFVTKLGGEHYDLSLDSVKFDSNWLRLPREVSLRFQNPGNVAVVPRGTVKLFGPHNKLVGQGVINEDSSYILPDSHRQMTIPLSSIAPARVWPATYKLQVNYRYDGLEQAATREISFKFINLPFLLFVTALLAILGYGIYHYRYRLWKTLLRLRSKP